jgi:hypothetical protein
VPGGTSYWADLTWTRLARGHLLVGRRHQQLWRSQRTYPHTYPANIGLVVLRRHELAFSYYRGRRPSCTSPATARANARSQAERLHSCSYAPASRDLA